jgi:hypothetical protein
MRIILIVFAILIQSSLAAAQESVQLGQTVTRLVATDGNLRQWCRSPGAYDACTIFVGFHLEASCVSSGSDWMISAAAQVTPFILLRNIEHLPHEQEHIRDVRRMLAEYLATLGAQRFVSREECGSRAARENSAFGETLRGFVSESNRRLH